MNKKGNTYKYLFPSLILVLVLVSVLLYWLNKNNYLNCIGINISVCLSSKKYTSKTNVFTFRYPSVYPLTLADKQYIDKTNAFYALEKPPKTVLYEILNFDTNFDSSAGGNRKAFLQVEKNNLSNIDEYIKQEESYYSKIKSAIPEFKKIVISGEQVANYTVGSGSAFTTSEVRYVFFHNSQMYTFSFYDMSKDGEQGREIILSTFKFLK